MRRAGKASTVFAADFDDDQDLDLVLGDISGNVHVVINRGARGKHLYGAPLKLELNDSTSGRGGDTGPVHLASQLGVPVLRLGTVLVLPNATFLVADECSGFSALYAALGVSIVLAATARRLPRRILLLLAAFPLAVLCNVVRVTVLVGLANRFGLGLLDTPFHAASGVATFWAVLVLLFAIADREGLRASYA